MFHNNGNHFSWDTEVLDAMTAIMMIQVPCYDGVNGFFANGTRGSIDHPVTGMHQILMGSQKIDIPVCMECAMDSLLQ